MRPWIFRTTATLAILTSAAGRPARAQCPTNPQGGPSVLRIATAADGVGTDFDLGTRGVMHDVVVPSLKLDVCLSGCDAATNATCTVDEIRPDAASPGLAPPIPLSQSGVLLCTAIAFPTPIPSATGTADVASGAITLQTMLQTKFFYGATPSAICPECLNGTCAGGANAGAGCQVESSVTVGAKTYMLSHACQPSGTLAGAPKIPVTFTTATATQAACANQASSDVCSTQLAGTCGASGCTQDASGITQECCSLNGARSCFPPSGVSRSGTGNPPSPAWGAGSQYPKTATETLVNASCTSAIGTAVLDSIIGLPGIAAAELDATTTWFGTDPGTTTTTTQPGATTTTQPGATTTTTTQPGATTTTTLGAACSPADCTDGDDCTADACVAGGCSHTLAPGIAGVRCLVDQLAAGPLCADGVDAKTAKAIAAALGKADALLGKADGSTGKKQLKSIKKAKSALAGIAKVTRNAVKKKKISTTCQSAIGERLSRVGTALAAVP